MSTVEPRSTMPLACSAMNGILQNPQHCQWQRAKDCIQQTTHQSGHVAFSCATVPFSSCYSEEVDDVTESSIPASWPRSNSTCAPQFRSCCTVNGEEPIRSEVVLLHPRDWLRAARYCSELCHRCLGPPEPQAFDAPLLAQEGGSGGGRLPPMQGEGRGRGRGGGLLLPRRTLQAVSTTLPPHGCRLHCSPIV